MFCCIWMLLNCIKAMITYLSSYFSLCQGWGAAGNFFTASSASLFHPPLSPVFFFQSPSYPSILLSDKSCIEIQLWLVLWACKEAVSQNEGWLSSRYRGSCRAVLWRELGSVVRYREWRCDRSIVWLDDIPCPILPQSCEHKEVPSLSLRGVIYNSACPGVFRHRFPSARATEAEFANYHRNATDHRTEGTWR